MIPTTHSPRDQVECLFLVKVLGGSTLAEFDKHIGKVGIDSNYFQEPLSQIIDWVVKHRIKHQEIPPPDLTARAWNELPTLLQGYAVPKSGLGSLYDEVVNGAMRDDVLVSLQDLHKQMVERVPAFDIKDAMTMHLQVMNAKYSRYKSEIKDFHEYATDLEQDYNDRLTGIKLGIPCPFLFLQEQLGGWQPAQITTVVAPTSAGKTWWLGHNVIAGVKGNPYIYHRPNDLPAWSPEQMERARARILFVSLEMAPIDIARRLAALVSGTSFNRLMKQRLTDQEREYYFQTLRNLKSDGPDAWVGKNLRLIGPNEAATPEQVAAQAEEFGADMVVIDGFYYMDGPGDDRWKKVEYNMRQMRLHTLMSNRHYMLATQLQRGKGTLNQAQPDTVAFSSSISHDSNNMIFLVPPKDPGNNTRTIDQKLGKARDGDIDQPYRFQWDYFDMRFAQLGPVQDMSQAAQSAY